MRGGGARFDRYVNDRPYVASSFLSVALSEVFASALGGRSKDRPDLAATALPLEAVVAALPCRGGETLLRRLFEPLGYQVTMERLPLDERFPNWGESAYVNLHLKATCRLADLLRHLYVLIPVVDDEKHYWVGEAEIEKLVRQGEGWLAGHPERALIARRYLAHQNSLARAALARLVPEEAAIEVEEAIAEPATDVSAEGKTHAPAVPPDDCRLSLHEQRLRAVLAAIQESGAQKVLDLGCGEGRLLQKLLWETKAKQITGLDISSRALEKARDRLRLDQLPPHQAERVKLIHGSLTYQDVRLAGHHIAALVEVIEHLDLARLGALERTVFGSARPEIVLVTTPNREYNARYEFLPEGELRHDDHRFEWSRAEFAAWADTVAERFAYDVRITPIGPEDPELGAPSQMATFTRR